MMTSSEPGRETRTCVCSSLSLATPPLGSLPHILAIRVFSASGSLYCVSSRRMAVVDATLQDPKFERRVRLDLLAWHKRGDNDLE